MSTFSFWRSRAVGFSVGRQIWVVSNSTYSQYSRSAGFPAGRHI